MIYKQHYNKGKQDTWDPPGRNINISSTTVKEQAYKSLVRPSLEYACSVWDPYTKENITQLEQVQRRAARYVTNHYHNTSSVSNMKGQFNW